MSDLVLKRDNIVKLFEATEAGDLTFDDFASWLLDELDERLEVAGSEMEALLA